MIIGIIVVELFMDGVSSLKAKRKEIRSIKDRLKNTFNVSVSEIDNQELWQRSSIGIVTVGSDTSHVQESLDRVVNFLERNWSHLILEIRNEVIHL